MLERYCDNDADGNKGIPAMVMQFRVKLFGAGRFFTNASWQPSHAGAVTSRSFLHWGQSGPIEHETFKWPGTMDLRYRSIADLDTKGMVPPVRATSPSGGPARLDRSQLRR